MSKTRLEPIQLFTVTIGGLPAKTLTLTAPSSFAGCTLTSDGAYRIWQLPLGATFDMTQSAAWQVWILEVDGQRLVITSHVTLGDPPNTPVLDSINFPPQH